jgi:hypothetical protein
MATDEGFMSMDETARAKAALLQSAGGLLLPEQAAALLGITCLELDRNRRHGQLLGVQQRGQWRYPRAQFDAGKIIPGMTDVVASFAAANPWVALDFLMTEDSVLEGWSPRDALLAGGPWRDRVATLLRGIQQGDGFA